MTPSEAAAVAAGVALWLTSGPGAAAGARLEGLQPRARGLRARPSGWPPPAKAAAVAAAAGAGGSGLVLGPGAVLAAGLLCGEGVRRVLRARTEREAAALRAQVASWCAAVAGELRVGRTADDALSSAAAESDRALGDVLAPVVAVAHLGGDVAAALSAAADRPGADSLRHVAACWAVASDAGAGLAQALQRLAAGLAATERLRSEVIAQLATARASARVLALLPVVGLLLGQVVGAAPLRFLLHTPAGGTCLTASVLLNVAGLAWTDRIAARVPLP
ncbi:MAG: type II secretion system F family protein [Actinomycetes bacterium]